MRTRLFTVTRIWAAAIVLVVIAGIVGAALLLDSRPLTQADVAAVTSACPRCHGQIPDYDFVSGVHDRHAAFECSRCHGGSGGLATTDGVHSGLRWFGAGAALIVLTAIIANSVISGRKVKVG